MKKIMKRLLTGVLTLATVFTALPVTQVHIFTQDGEQVKVSVSVKYLDQRTKATQISQFDLTLEKDSNWKIVK